MIKKLINAIFKFLGYDDHSYQTMPSDDDFDYIDADIDLDESDLENLDEFENQDDINTYSKKDLMTKYELNFYYKIKELENDYMIIPQLNLATVIKKEGKFKYQNELFRNIDFAIFSKDYKELLLLIEINDNTHNTKKRQYRDIKVKKLCNDIKVELITFYTKYPNSKEYVVNRIKNHLKCEERVLDSEEKN